MKGVTKAMGQMNRQMNLPSLQKIMQEFMKQNEKMELMTEVMEDAIDDALEGDEEEEETEELVSQVLDEIGIDMNQEVALSLTSLIFFSGATYQPHSKWITDLTIFLFELFPPTARERTLNRCRCTSGKDKDCTGRSNGERRRWNR